MMIELAGAELSSLQLLYRRNKMLGMSFSRLVVYLLLLPAAWVTGFSSPTLHSTSTPSRTSLSMDRRSILESIGSTTVAAISNLEPMRSSSRSMSTATSSPIPSTTLPPRVWLDADPSGLVWTGLDCDDDLAVLVALALHDNHAIQLEGLSVCGGNAPLRHTWKDMQVLLRHADSASSFAPQKGYGWKSMQVSRDWLQTMNRIQPDVLDSKDATQAMIDAAFADDTAQKLTILTIGPPTNLAKALQREPKLTSRLEHVYMMGGELTQQRLDLNFASDRAAARTVVDANVPTTLIPIQTCAQVVLDDVFVRDSEADYCKSNQKNKAAACALLPKMKQQVQTMPELVNKAVAKRMPADKRWIPSPNLDRGFIPWDIVAILAVAYPHLFTEWEYHTVSFPTCPQGEPCDRTMVVSDTLPREQWPSTTNDADAANNYNHSGIVRIPHVVQSETEIKTLMQELLFQTPASTQRPTPRIMLGFLGPLGLSGVTVTTAIGLLARRIFA